MRCDFKILSVCIISLWVCISSAEAAKEEEVELEEIVVTATRSEKEIEHAPANVCVVTKEEMEKKNIKSLDEALNALPGVFNR